MGSIAEPSDSPISSLRSLATDILQACTHLEAECQRKGISQPGLSAGSDTAFWSDKVSPELTEIRYKTLGQLDVLTTLLQGPHDFLHELTASNWDHGALYVFLQSGLLDAMANGGHVSLASLAKQSGLPEDKLVRIMGLLKCRHIVDETEANVFTLTAVSEEMVHDSDFTQWVGFQLYETRVASAHLADALSNKPNTYKEGATGFKTGFGAEMYQWHAERPAKGERFRRAMKGVSTSLDPADSLIRNWFKSQAGKSKNVVELGGRYGFASIALTEYKEDLSLEVRCDTEDFLRRGEALVKPDCHNRIAFTQIDSIMDPVRTDDASKVPVYLIRNFLWNWQDDDVVKMLRSLLSNPGARVVITDGVSPKSGDFPPHVEIGYRRRDVTTMTMHNVKQRNQAEWLAMFAEVNPSVKVNPAFQKSSHVFKGLWELSLAA